MKNAIDPSPVVGIVGAGQLARMTIAAAIPLAISIRLLADRADDGAAIVSPHVTIGSPDDPAALTAFARECDVLTFDHELVPRSHLDHLAASGVCLYPSAETRALAQNTRLQRERFSAAGLPVPPYLPFTNQQELAAFGRNHGWPVVLKAARGGYDGRGVWFAADETRGLALAESLIARGVELLAEQFVPITRELAILVARRPSGQTAVYPLVESIQVDGMCREILAPALVPPVLAKEAHEIAATIAALSGAVGMLAVELFESDGRLLINEIATRPHNSGHFTIEGCVTSQFEQHLRAILDWPLGATDLHGPAVVMVNVTGGADGVDPASRLAHALAVPGAHIHLYGKRPRPGRKLGHVTVIGSSREEARAAATCAVRCLVGSTT